MDPSFNLKGEQFNTRQTAAKGPHDDMHDTTLGSLKEPPRNQGPRTAVNDLGFRVVVIVLPVFVFIASPTVRSRSSDRNGHVSQINPIATQSWHAPATPAAHTLSSLSSSTGRKALYEKEDRRITHEGGALH